MDVSTNAGQDRIDVLAVEDSPTQAEQLKYILEQSHFKVMVARDGKQALAILDDLKPTLIISDIVMPEMNGYELCRRIKSDLKNRSIPVILLTALSDTRDVLEGIACGADGFITKPYNEEYLIRRVEQTIAVRTELRKDYWQVSMEDQFPGMNRSLCTDPQRMLNMLISTYEAAVNRNTELLQAQKQLSMIYDQLEDEVKKRTMDLIKEIAERKHAEDALHEVNRKLNLLSNITRHDINNQLMAMTGYLTLLKIRQPDLASDDGLLKTESAAKRISAMILFTKEYQDIGVQAPVWQDVRALVEKETREITIRPIKIVNSIPPGIEVYADPLIIKVLHNLVDNAVHHGKRTSMIRFNIEEHNGARALVCEDDGIGIATEMKENIFTRELGKAHGYGLFLSKEILAITGITIAEDGEPGRGARFVMTIPPNEIKLV